MFFSSRFVAVLQLIFSFFMRGTVVPSAPFHSNGQAEFSIMRDINVNKAFSLSVTAIILSLSSFSSPCRRFPNSWCAEK